MLSQDAILTQNKIVGVLVRQARLHVQKSVDECAQALACEPELLTRMEEGEEGLTLPQLEALSDFLNVPLLSLLGEEEMPGALASDSVPYAEIMLVRRKIIGVVLRQARLEAGRTLDEAASLLGYTPDLLASVELGEERITLPELLALIKALGIPFERLVGDEVTPLVYDEHGNHDSQRLSHLSPDVREFVLKPINLPYLQVAMNLSRMPSETMRQIASGLLEITY